MNLNIELTHKNNETMLACTGRLDANSAGHLNDYINNLVREGHYSIALNLTGIEYLSSAGIRTLVNQYKNLASVNGMFYIAEMSDNVRQVLDMVGMETMLSKKPEPQSVEKPKKEEKNEHLLDNYKFSIIDSREDKKTILNLFGNPGIIPDKGYSSEQARTIQSGDKLFSLGLGAIGESFDECRQRFGEYIVAGKNAAYLPADGSQKPDFMQSSGKLVASLIGLYGISFTENYSWLIRFEPQRGHNSIGFSTLINHISEITGKQDFALVMVAESGGLVGTSLNASPVTNTDIFSFPEVKNNVNFTTEPAHNKMLTLSTGIIASKNTKEAGSFVRPLNDNGQHNGHIHSMVFPYTPLKRTNIDLYEIIDYLFENSELTDLLHLTNDNREINGIGESRFVQGFCWITPIESIKHQHAK
ncbi:MAG: STAS domain-containing protein [Prolixibacteraceae bacterium]|nr:STAS domain-containing protein [Prolixibacteraceae bacterium]MBN2650173.1 STAS domain-containing protein [Prolixibacteraceae bacterium]